MWNKKSRNRLIFWQILLGFFGAVIYSPPVYSWGPLDSSVGFQAAKDTAAERLSRPEFEVLVVTWRDWEEAGMGDSTATCICGRDTAREEYERKKVVALKKMVTPGEQSFIFIGDPYITNPGGGLDEFVRGMTQDEVASFLERTPLLKEGWRIPKEGESEEVLGAAQLVRQSHDKWGYAKKAPAEFYVYCPVAGASAISGETGLPTPSLFFQYFPGFGTGDTAREGLFYPYGYTSFQRDVYDPHNGGANHRGILLFRGKVDPERDTPASIRFGRKR